MFKNERRTGEAGKSYPPFALSFSLVVRKYKQLIFCGGSWGYEVVTLNMDGRDGTRHRGICICIVRIRWGYAR